VVMSAWNPKRERRYEYVKDSVAARGKSPEVAVAAGIAARTMNKAARARAGEARSASVTSLLDLSSAFATRRSGQDVSPAVFRGPARRVDDARKLDSYDASKAFRIRASSTHAGSQVDQG
jgi:hypothetical protein